MQLHNKYLRSLENSERTRLACLKYLQRGLIYFHAERPDLLREVEKWAKDLDGGLPVPRLSWKYAWIKTLFGWKPALRTQDKKGHESAGGPSNAFSKESFFSRRPSSTTTKSPGEISPE